MNPEAAGQTGTDLQNAITDLFPPGVTVNYSASCPPEAELLPAELEYTRNMVASRLQEFCHGRHCARLAMQQLGLPPAAVGKRPDRSPEWPAGVTGTIAHTGSVAAAAVARAEHCVSLGLDIERAGPLEAETARLIVRPDEEGGVHGNRARILFSIKESIYKCIHPVVRTYVDFQEMRVDLSGPPGSFGAVPDTNNFDGAMIAGLAGRYLVTDDLIISACWIMPTR